jgi:hypothetical protein
VNCDNLFMKILHLPTPAVGGIVNWIMDRAYQNNLDVKDIPLMRADLLH